MRWEPPRPDRPGDVRGRQSSDTSGQSNGAAPRGTGQFLARSRTLDSLCSNATPHKPPTSAKPTSRYAKSRFPYSLDEHAKSGVSDDVSIPGPPCATKAVVSTFQVCLLCRKPLPHEYDLPPMTVTDTGQNPITAATMTSSPAVISATRCGPDS
jgi:hypothetical protein